MQNQKIFLSFFLTFLPLPFSFPTPRWHRLPCAAVWLGSGSEVYDRAVAVRHAGLQGQDHALAPRRARYASPTATASQRVALVRPRCLGSGHSEGTLPFDGARAEARCRRGGRPWARWPDVHVAVRRRRHGSARRQPQHGCGMRDSAPASVRTPGTIGRRGAAVEARTHGGQRGAAERGAHWSSFLLFCFSSSSSSSSLLPVKRAHCSETCMLPCARDGDGLLSRL